VEGIHHRLGFQSNNDFTEIAPFSVCGFEIENVGDEVRAKGELLAME